MKKALQIVFGLLLALGALSAHAQRIFSQAELDTLLAPIALYPDPLLTHVLNASVYPDDVMAAAEWSRANPQLQGDAALATVESTPWHPSVKALVAYPDVLARLAESPQWLADLGEAYTGQAAYVSATIQQLRGRAQATGYLRSDDQQYVYQQGQTIVVQPVYPNLVYAPYYDPFVVYGTWWWPAFRPVCFTPFIARPIFVTRVIQPVPVRIVERPLRFEHSGRLARPVQVTPAWRNTPAVHQPVRMAPPSGQSSRFHFPQATQSAPAVQQPARVAPPAQWQRTPVVQSAPSGQSGRWHFPQTAQSAPAVRQPARVAPPAQWQRAPVAQSAPIMRSMPAPQARATERSVGHSFGQGFRAAAGGGGGGGGRGNGGRHRS